MVRSISPGMPSDDGRLRRTSRATSSLTTFLSAGSPSSFIAAIISSMSTVPLSSASNTRKHSSSCRTWSSERSGCCDSPRDASHATTLLPR